MEERCTHESECRHVCGVARPLDSSHSTPASGCALSLSLPLDRIDAASFSRRSSSERGERAAVQLTLERRHQPRMRRIARVDSRSEWHGATHSLTIESARDSIHRERCVWRSLLHPVTGALGVSA
jgi:hypothetical protein